MTNDYFERSNSLENIGNRSLSAKSRTRWGRAHAQKHLKRHVATSAVLSATLVLSMASPAFAAVDSAKASMQTQQATVNQSRSGDRAAASEAASERSYDAASPETIRKINEIADQLFKNETIIPYLMGTGYIKTAEGTNYDVGVPNDKLKYIGGQKYLGDSTRIAPGLIEEAVFYQILSEAARLVEKAPRVTEDEAQSYYNTLKGILLTYGIKEKMSLQDDGEYVLLSKALNTYNVKFKEMQQAEYGSNIYVPTGKENTQAKELFARAELVKWGNYLDLNFLTDPKKVRSITSIAVAPFLNKRISVQIGHVGNATNPDGFADTSSNIFTMQLPGEFSATQLMCTITYVDAQGNTKKVGPVGVDIDYDKVNASPNKHNDGHNYISPEYDVQTRTRLSYWKIRGEAILAGLNRNNPEHKKRIAEINKAIQEIDENLKQSRPSYTKALKSAVPIYKTEIAFAISSHFADVITSHYKMLDEKSIINEKKYTKASIENYKKKLAEFDKETTNQSLDIPKLIKDIKVLDDATTGSILEYNASRLENIVNQLKAHTFVEDNYELESYYKFKLALEAAKKWLAAVKRRPPLDETSDYEAKLRAALAALQLKPGKEDDFKLEEPEDPDTSDKPQQEAQGVVSVALKFTSDTGSFVVPNFYEPQGKLDKKNHTLTIYLTKEAEDKVKQIDYSGAHSVQTTAYVTTEGDKKVVVLENFSLNSHNAIPADIAFTINGATRWNNASTIAFTELAAIKKEKETVEKRVKALLNTYSKPDGNNVLSYVCNPLASSLEPSAELKAIIPDVLIQRAIKTSLKIMEVGSIEKNASLTDEQRMNHIDTAEDMLKTCNKILVPYVRLANQIAAAETTLKGLSGKTEQDIQAAKDFISSLSNNFKSGVKWDDQAFSDAERDLNSIADKAQAKQQTLNEFQKSINALINQAQTLYDTNSANKFPENNLLMSAAIVNARNALPKVTSETAKEAIEKSLTSAMNAYSSSINKSDIKSLDKKDADKIVEQASTLELGDHPAGAWTVLQSQINATRDKIAHADSQDAIKAAETHLEQQINKFKATVKQSVPHVVADKPFAAATYVVPDRKSDHAFLNAAVWTTSKIIYDGLQYKVVLTLKPALNLHGEPYAATTKIEYSYDGKDWKNASTLTSDQNVLLDYSNNTYLTSVSVPLLADNVLKDKPLHVRVTYVERIDDQRDAVAHNETKTDTAEVIFDSQSLVEYQPSHEKIDVKKLIQAYNAQLYGVNTQIAEQSVVEKAKKLIANPDTVSDVQETTLLLRHGNAKQPVKKDKEWLDAASAMSVVLKTAQNFTQDASFKKLPAEKQKAFIASIEEATKYILADSTHSKDELDAKREALNNSYNELVKQTGVVTLSPLESVLGKANTIKQGRKPDDAWNVFKDVLFKVQSQYSKWSTALPTSQEIVTKEVNKLQSAIDTLNGASDEALNLDELRKDITAARNLLAASPAESHMHQMLNDAISKAEQFLQNEANTASKADLREQLTILQNAVRNYQRSLSLTPKPDPQPGTGGSETQPGGSGTQPGGGTENPPAPGPGPNPQTPQDNQVYTVSLFAKNTYKNAFSAASPCIYWRGILDKANNKMYLSLTLVPWPNAVPNTPFKCSGGITNLEYKVSQGDGAWRPMRLSADDLKNSSLYSFTPTAKGYTYPSGASLELPADAIAPNRDTVIPIKVNYYADGAPNDPQEALLYINGDTLTKGCPERWSENDKDLVRQRAFIKMNKIPITAEAMKTALTSEQNYALSAVDAARAYGELLLATVDALKTYPSYQHGKDPDTQGPIVSKELKEQLDNSYKELQSFCDANSRKTEGQIKEKADNLAGVLKPVIQAMERQGSLLSQSSTTRGVGTPWYEAAPEPNPSVPGGSDPSVPTPPPAPIPGGQGGSSEGGSSEGDTGGSSDTGGGSYGGGSYGGGSYGGGGGGATTGNAGSTPTDATTGKDAQAQNPDAAASPADVHAALKSLEANPLQQQVVETEQHLAPLIEKQFAPVAEPTHPVKQFEQVTQRVAGETAMDTMSKVIDQSFNKARTVVLASKDGYWDALSASALAGTLKAPVLLSGRDALPQETLDQLLRLGTKRVYLVGGRSVMSNAVLDQLRSLGISTVTVAGQQAQDTANMVARKLPSSEVCFIATSWGYQDALSASSFAYAKRAPMFLTNGAGMLDRSTLACIRSKNFKRVVLIGGESVLSPEIVQQLNKVGIKDIQRIAGDTAYDTSALFAQWALNHGMKANNMAIATGYGYEDALVGAALCGKKDSIMVLADDSNTSAVDLIVDAQKNKISNYYILGGESVVGNRVNEGLQNVFSSFGDDVNAADSADGASLQADINSDAGNEAPQASAKPAPDEDIAADINDD